MQQMHAGRILSPSLNHDEFYRRLVEDEPDAIIICRCWRDDRVLELRCGANFGFSEAEVLGHSLDMIIPEALRKHHWDAYQQTMRTGNTRYGAGDMLAVPGMQKAALVSPLNSASSRFVIERDAC
jgi:hypothetical protein